MSCLLTPKSKYNTSPTAEPFGPPCLCWHCWVWTFLAFLDFCCSCAWIWWWNIQAPLSGSTSHWASKFACLDQEYIYSTVPYYFTRLLGLALLYAPQCHLALFYNYLFISVMLIPWGRTIVGHFCLQVTEWWHAYLRQKICSFMKLNHKGRRVVSNMNREV